MKHSIATVVLASLVTLIAPFAAIRPVAPVAAFHEPTLLDDFPIASLSSTPVVAGGGYVAWLAHTGELDERGYNKSLIKAALLPDREPIVVAEVRVNDWYWKPLDTDGEVVVWVDERERGVIQGKRISGGEAFVIAELPTGSGAVFVSAVTVSGDWVVWSSYDDAFSRVQARNIATMSEVVTLAEAPTGETQVGGVDTDDGWVVWGEEPVNVAWQELVVKRLGSDDPELRFDNRGEGDRSGYRLANGVLALEKYLPTIGDTAFEAVRLIDLETLAEREVVVDYTEHIDGRNYPYVAGLVGFDGRYLYVAFQLSIPTSSPGLQQIVAYDLETDSIFPVLRDSPALAGAEDGVLFWRMGGMVHAARLSDRLPTASMPDERPPDTGYPYFAETGHYLQLGFRAYWERNGGLPVFGYPLTEEYRERNRDTGEWYTVQFTERQRFEWHPENAGTPYQVLLGRLGAELLTAQGRDWKSFPTADPSSPNYFPKTGHAVPAPFWDYWASHGLDFGDPGVSYRESLALFGYPLSEPMVETNTDGDTILTQYFERAVFEHHPSNPPESQVLLRRVGADKLIERGWSTPAIDNVSSFEFRVRLTGSFPGPPLRLQLLMGDEPTLLTLDSLNGVDLPEAGACYFTETEAYLFDRLSGPRESTLVIDGVDRYEFDPDWSAWVIDGVDRIWLDGELLNETLLRDGYATLASDDPDPLMQARLLDAAQEAVRLNRGIWQACGLD